MSFNSWQFIVFFLVVYGLYISLRSVRAQNVLLLLASWYFYSAWDPRFLSLLLISTGIDFAVGRALGRVDDARKRKLLITTSVVAQLSMLAFFKYFNFFVASGETLLQAAGIPASHVRLNIVLPVGISFYTFQTLSYTIDVYRRRLKPAESLLDFAVFVSFFPQLVAGPIERATHLLPQVQNARRIDPEQIRRGLWLIALGLWKKVVIADNLAMYVDPVFAHSYAATGFEVYVATIAFAFQIYCDFSAYSDIARGTAALMGFDLMLNFSMPYLATSPSDFWRRWHISLSTWLRDYLYIPLGGNRGGRRREYRNLMLTMFLGGLWHGASWNFVWWGVYHGALLTLQRVFSLRSAPDQEHRFNIVRVVAMFHLTLIGWLLFRATGRVDSATGVSIGSAHQLLELFGALFQTWRVDRGTWSMALSVLVFIAPIGALEYWQYRSRDLDFAVSLRRRAVGVMLGCMCVSWILWGVKAGSEFIYFRF